MLRRRTRKAEEDRLQLVHSQDQLGEKIARLEAGVGLREKDGGARYGFGDREIREAYFRVDDVEIRKALITFHLSIVDGANKLMGASIDSARENLEEAKRGGLLAAEVGPVIVGLLAVWVGYKLNGLVGEIGGAVVGVFLGLSYLRSNESARQFAIELAKGYLDDELREKRDNYPIRPRFNEEEARTGFRDTSFDQEARQFV